MEIIIIFLAKYLHLFVIAGAVLVGALSEPKTRKALFILAIIAIPIAYGVGELTGFLIENPRPFVVEGVAPLIPHVPNNGFPSTHALIAMTVASVVFVHNRKAGYVLFALALLVGLGRVMALVHNPIDVLGSTVIALAVTWCATVASKRIQSKHTYEETTA